MAKFRGSKIEELMFGFNQMDCCGLVEYSGMGHINSKSDAEHLRRAGFDAERRGYVLATTTGGARNQTARRGRFLKEAGFSRLTRFRNPRTGNYVTVWGAPTLKRGAIDDSRGYDVIF